MSKKCSLTVNRSAQLRRMQMEMRCAIFQVQCHLNHLQRRMTFYWVILPHFFFLSLLWPLSVRCVLKQMCILFAGFTVHIKPDAHLDDTVPICARDQHLLYNIFGNEWKSSTIIDAYIAVKGQTGFMNKWSQTMNATEKQRPHSSN